MRTPMVHPFAPVPITGRSSLSTTGCRGSGHGSPITSSVRPREHRSLPDTDDVGDFAEDVPLAGHRRPALQYKLFVDTETEATRLIDPNDVVCRSRCDGV